MLIYNLFAWRNNGNERKYLYYALYITSIGVFFACINGIASQYLWPDWPGFSKRMMVLALGSTVLFGGLFTRSFLGLAASRPGLDRFTLGICALGGLITITGLWLPYSIVIQPLIILVVVAAGTALLSGAIRWHDGHPAAVMFCLAWLILGLGVTALGTNKLGWIPRNPFTEYMAQLGSMLEFILLSLALIRQINIERKAKSEARKTALEFERQANLSRQQALIVQQQAAVELEARVQRRTAELQIANDKLSALSTTDPLTGLKNRRFFNERYLAEFVRSKRDGTPISVLIIDVDHFKSVNDCYGHLLGDEVLKRVAQLIEHEARRECDIVTRHGGEEFSAVLIDNSPLQALAMAEKIRRRIADNAYQDDELSLQCTVSVGVATMTPTPHSSPEELIKQADEALYQSKSTGRNRVSVYSEQAA
jgi:diguanylate cyclase